MVADDPRPVPSQGAWDRSSGSIRPAPEWMSSVIAARGDPLKMNRPGPLCPSIMRRTASQTTGTLYHSSISSGRGSETQAASGSFAAIPDVGGWSSRSVAAAERVAVPVLPTPLTPSMRQAGRTPRRCSSCSAVGWLVGFVVAEYFV